MNSNDEAVFGFPDFAETVLAAQGPALRLAIDDSHLGNEMIAALPKQMTLEQIVIHMLVQMTITGWIELLTLVGHGCGLGAMKISRGMFETAVMAEYLRREPTEMEDYIEYGRVLNFTFEAMVAHLSRNEATIDIDQPPSLRWIKQALASGHVYLLQAFHTLNEFFSLGFDERLEAAGAAFEKVWR